MWKFTALILLSLTTLIVAKDKIAENKTEEIVDDDTKVKVSKCCAVHHVLLESKLGDKRCVHRDTADFDDSLRWNMRFYDPDTFDALAESPASYRLLEGYPQCDESKGEAAFAAFMHEHTDDDFMLLTNGTLAHRLVHDDGTQSRLYLYEPGKYCMDQLVVAHNSSGVSQDDNVVEFAYLCLRPDNSISTLFQQFIYPVGLSVSVLCLIATFLLYSFLPQLRDLTGKFILGICGFFGVAVSLAVVKLYGRRDPGVDPTTTEFCLHASVVGIWLCLSSMGHHVWQTVRRKSVFTRVTDGTKLCYYSAFVLGMLGVISGVAVTCHYLISGKQSAKMSWEVLVAFYAPVTVALIVNLFFYWTTQRKMARKMLYNRSMQHFQVNFDLYIKFLIVIGVWWFFFVLAFLEDVEALVYISKAFSMLEGPLIFIIAMCRTRVAFLFKRYFCIGPCCQTGEFIEEEAKELSVIDNLRAKEAKDDDDMPTSSLLRATFSDEPDSGDMERIVPSRSLFCVRAQGSEVPAPPDPDQPVGRVKRLLKSNSLTAIANINWGWRRETSV